ncbi:MAG TPA: citrate synthase [Actinomycetota bacterium]|nr:citrate synthase [Actinomycetota bacterium]
MAEGKTARKVADIMSSPVVTAAPDETIAEVAERIRDSKVGSVVVTEGDKPVGILTERDLAHFAAGGRSAAEAKVSEIMTADPDVITPDTRLEDTYRSFASSGYRHMPVVADDNLVGIVSMRDLMRVAHVTPVEEHALEVPRGLEGVAVAETEIGDVRGREGFYHYRQYNAVELAEKRSIEDVWHLLFEGELPSKEQREKFIEEIRPLRQIPGEVKEILPNIARLGEKFRPLDALRSAYSVLASSLDLEPWLDVEYEELRKQALATCAVFPSLIMAMYRLRHGMEVVDPHPELGYSENYLYTMTGEVPDKDHARAIEQYQISTIDHGFNASTFTARVITSTGADLGSAIAGALGALSGPLHGGAPSRALDMLDAIQTPDNAEPWLRDAVSSGQRLMGFGHRVYKTDDPRSVMLRGVAERLGGPKIEFGKHVERTAVKVLQELKPGRDLYANVEFYAGIVMDTAGIPRELFTPTFASSRVIGWSAHILEQAADNRLIRPAAHYKGPEPPQPVPDPE